MLYLLNRFLEFLFIPYYDELALFTMSYVCMLLLAINYPFSQFHSDDVWAIVIFSPFLLGMLLCFYHAFTKRLKTNAEKKLMMLFAATISGYSGIWGGTYILVERINWGFSPFPIWNIISGYILLNLLRDSNIEEKTISEENISLGQLLTSTVIITGLFYLCYFRLDLNWAVTFSICIAWVTNIYSRVNSMLFRERAKISLE
jgi:hypothetical protein